MPHSSVVVGGRSNGDLLSSKMNSLLAGTKSDVGEDDELISELRDEAKREKKGFFGLLGRKK